MLLSDALVKARLALVRSGSDDLSLVVHGDGHAFDGLLVRGGPVLLLNSVVKETGLVHHLRLLVLDLDGNRDLIILGDFLDSGSPLAGNLGAATTAVGDAASAIGGALAIAVSAATVGRLLAGGDGVERDFDGFATDVLIHFGVAGALLGSPLSSELLLDDLDFLGLLFLLDHISGVLIHDLIVGGLVLHLVGGRIDILHRVTNALFGDASPVCGATASGAATA